MMDGLAEGWPKERTGVKTWRRARQRASNRAGHSRNGKAKRTQGQAIVEGKTGATVG